MTILHVFIVREKKCKSSDPSIPSNRSHSVQIEVKDTKVPWNCFNAETMTKDIEEGDVSTSLLVLHIWLIIIIIFIFFIQNMISFSYVIASLTVNTSSSSNFKMEIKYAD